MATSRRVAGVARMLRQRSHDGHMFVAILISRLVSLVFQQATETSQGMWPTEMR